ncbi:SdiA-regulated domain-containing protein [Pseudomonas sp. SCB32]|uniref:SdiA-regulated domain-containing protein n=1 Tax=Pseudomonas sp. SCB32 TaxID=2653853 RepID=UPI0012659B65|nr:SdiA-regulated domain-containing protein [Pseudomonas sp. SCB32]
MNRAADSLEVIQPHPLRHRFSWRAWAWLALVLVLLLPAVTLALLKHWPQRAYFYFSSQLHAADWAGRSVWLPDYKVVIDALPVKGIESDLSAISFDFDHDRLIAVTNSGAMKLAVLSKSGEMLAQYPLVGFEDVEGVAYLGDGLVAVSDENLQQIDFFALPEQPGQSIDARDVQSIALAINPSVHNKGFEGLTYDAEHDRLFIGKERGPRQIYEITGVRASLAGKLQLKVIDHTAWVKRSVFGTDISDLHYDHKSGHLLVLSEESRLIMELDGQGELVSFRSLGGFGDLKRAAPQAEGLTMDADGNLYVVSEPNLFYRFEKQR